MAVSRRSAAPTMYVGGMPRSAGVMSAARERMRVGENGYLPPHKTSLLVGPRRRDRHKPLDSKGALQPCRGKKSFGKA